MNLVIDFDESMLSEITNCTIRRLMKFGDYSTGELAKYVESRTRDAMAELLYKVDFELMVAQAVSEYTKGIVEQVVKEELKKMVRTTVKEMKDKGELI